MKRLPLVNMPKRKWRNNMKKIICLVVVVVLLMTLVACQPGNFAQLDQSKDIVTQKVIPEGKTPITVLVKYAFTINDFEKIVEKKFPDIDIVQVGNYTSNMGTAEYNRRLKHRDLTDIVMTWPLEVGEEYWEDNLLDLSTLPVTSDYNVSMLNNNARDGKLYYLPGPAQIRGIVYNKTLFKEKGWSVPTSFKEFTELCQKIEESGIRSIQLGFGNPEVLETAFTGYSYYSCFSKPSDAQKLANYNEGKGSFGDQYGPAFDTFQKMIDLNIWKKSDLDIYYQDREKMLFTRQCAMVEDSVLMARMGEIQTGSKDEFALMPFLNPGKDNDWVRQYMVCYIGLNKALGEAENKEKYDLVMKVLDFISTPEGQEALSSDTGGMLSSLNDTSLPNVPEINDLLHAMEAGRSVVFPTFKNVQKSLRKGLAGMVSGEMTKEDVIAMVDKENASPKVSDPLPILGKATQDFSLIETGNFITDIMRDTSGAEIALFLDNGKDGKYNGKGVSARIYKGELTSEDIACILPDLKHGEKGVLQKINMTGGQLINTLEHSVKVDNNIGGWFYYFSGLRIQYAPAAKPGDRIYKITDSNGAKIEPKKVYTIAIMDGSVPEKSIKSLEETGIKLDSMLANAIKDKKKISPSGDDRFVVRQP